MKIVGIFILILGLLVAFSIGFDIILGYELTAIKNTHNPFQVAGVVEISVFILLLILLVVIPVRASFKKRKEAKKNKQKQ